MVGSRHLKECSSPVRCVFLYLHRWGCVTVKVTASNPVDEETARHEQILTSYLEKNPSHEGCKFVSKMLDNFEVPGEEGLSTYSIWQACTHLSTLA